jgi:hypothetical protein
MSTFDSLDNTFKVSPTRALDVNLKKTRIENNLPTPLPDQDKELESDFQDAREILKKTADYSEQAIQGILHIAKNSDSARAYEVVGQLIKTLQDNAQGILEVQEKKAKVSAIKKIPVGNSVTNNNLFVGSTKDLLRALNKDIIENE